MSRRPTPRRARRVAAAVVTAVAALALAGCSAGAVTQTDTTVSTSTGSEVTIGQIAVVDLTIDPGPPITVPQGSTVFLRGTLVNQGPLTDQLVSVSAPFASGVAAQGPTVLPVDTSVRLIGTQPVPPGPPTQAPASDARLRVALQGTTRVLNAVPTYTVVLTFARSGSQAVQVPLVSSGPGAQGASY